MDGVSISGIIFMLFGAYFLLTGIATMATRKVFGFGSSMNKYTDESIRATAPVMGLGNVVLGITWVAAHLGDLVPSLSFLSDYSMWILIGGAVVGAVIVGIGSSKLVKKEDK